MIFKKLTKRSSVMGLVEGDLTQESFNTLPSLPFSTIEVQKQNSFFSLSLAARDDHITPFWPSMCKQEAPGCDFRKAFIYLLKSDRFSFYLSCPFTPST